VELEDQDELEEDVDAIEPLQTRAPENYAPFIPKLPEFENKARQADGKSFILEIYKNSTWSYDYIPPGTAKNRTRIWKTPSCKKMVQHLRICGGIVTYLTGIVCDGVKDNMQQLLLTIYEQLELKENEEYAEEWERLVKLGRRASITFGDDALLKGYSDGTAKGVAQTVKDLRKGNELTSKGQQDAGANEADAMLAGLAGDGETD